MVADVLVANKRNKRGAAKAFSSQASFRDFRALIIYNPVNGKQTCGARRPGELGVDYVIASIGYGARHGNAGIFRHEPFPWCF